MARVGDEPVGFALWFHNYSTFAGRPGLYLEDLFVRPAFRGHGGSGISFIVAILLNITLFMVLYLLLPHGGSTWREILPGALADGLLWDFAKRILLFFVSSYISVSNQVYGSVAAIFAFLVWAYLSGIIFLFGAYLSVSYYQLKQQKKEAAGLL